jgi:uncharacterized membrane protein
MQCNERRTFHTAEEAEAKIYRGMCAMRRILEIIGLTVLAFQVWLYCRDIYGSNRLPDRIPTHFDLAGHANGWDSPASFIFLPILSLALFLFFTLIARFSSRFSYPVEMSESNRTWLQSLAIDMIAWMKMEMVCTFAVAQWLTSHLARHPEPATYSAMLFAPLGMLFATVAWYIIAMRKAGRSNPHSDSEQAC